MTRKDRFIQIMFVFVIVAMGPLIFSVVSNYLMDSSNGWNARSYVGLLCMYFYYVGLIAAMFSYRYISVKRARELAKEG